jgi:hypothetical protein
LLLLLWLFLLLFHFESSFLQMTARNIHVILKTPRNITASQPQRTEHAGDAGERPHGSK